MSGMGWEKGIRERICRSKREEDIDRNREAGSSYVSDEHLAGTPQATEVRALGVRSRRSRQFEPSWKWCKIIRGTTPAVEPGVG